MTVASAIKDSLSSAVHSHDSPGTSSQAPETPSTHHDNTQPSSQPSHGRSASTSSTASTTTVNEKYLLRVTAGPSYDYDSHKLVYVNTDEPCAFENEFMTVKVKVRIKDFNGLPRSCPPDHHSYFKNHLHTKDLYSIAFTFTPKRDIPCQGTVWGNDFPHPVRDRLPPGFNTAFNIVKRFIDPGLECDAYADEPWLLGPSLSCWFTFWAGETNKGKMDMNTNMEEIVEEGGEGSGETWRKELGMPDHGDKRRKWALTASNRDKVVFEKGRAYSADFFNPYLDFSDFSLKLPGFSLNVLKYIDDRTHKLRYVFKNRETNEVYFVVVFSLLFGDELLEAVQDDEAAQKKEHEGHADQQPQPKQQPEHAEDAEDASRGATADAGTSPSVGQKISSQATAFSAAQQEEGGTQEGGRLMATELKSGDDVFQDSID